MEIKVHRKLRDGFEEHSTTATSVEVVTASARKIIRKEGVVGLELNRLVITSQQDAERVEELMNELWIKLEKPAKESAPTPDCAYCGTAEDTLETENPDRTWKWADGTVETDPDFSEWCWDMFQALVAPRQEQSIREWQDFVGRVASDTYAWDREEMRYCYEQGWEPELYAYELTCATPD